MAVDHTRTITVTPAGSNYTVVSDAAMESGVQWVSTTKTTDNNGVADVWTITIQQNTSSGRVATITATHSNNNTDTITVNQAGVNPDNTAPVITLLGDSSISVDVGASDWIDDGATAVDETDGDISNNIQVVDNVDLNTIGVYSVTYNVNDAAGNPAVEVVRTVNRQAKIGSRQTSNQTLGIFDLSTDADGRWSVEKYKGLIMQIEREANTIAKETRRGKGNFILCSSDVAAALNAAGMLDYTPALSSNLNVDDTGNTFAGTLNGRLKVYIDPYSTRDYINVGYKGTNPYDAGLFYCPYVPLTMVKAVGEEDFQPRIGFKTRYGMVSNPYVGSAPANGLASDRTNQYYRISAINNLLT